MADWARGPPGEGPPPQEAAVHLQQSASKLKRVLAYRALLDGYVLAPQVRSPDGRVGIYSAVYKDVPTFDYEVWRGRKLVWKFGDTDEGLYTMEPIDIKEDNRGVDDTQDQFYYLLPHSTVYCVTFNTAADEGHVKHDMDMTLALGVLSHLELAVAQREALYIAQTRLDQYGVSPVEIENLKAAMHTITEAAGEAAPAAGAGFAAANPQDDKAAEAKAKAADAKTMAAKSKADYAETKANTA